MRKGKRKCWGARSCRCVQFYAAGYGRSFFLFNPDVWFLLFVSSSFGEKIVWFNMKRLYLRKISSLVFLFALLFLLSLLAAFFAAALAFAAAVSALATASACIQAISSGLFFCCFFLSFFPAIAFDDLFLLIPYFLLFFSRLLVVFEKLFPEDSPPSCLSLSVISLLWFSSLLFLVRPRIVAFEFSSKWTLPEKKEG